MVGERAPLLGETSRANSKTRVGRRGAQGDASVMQALLMVSFFFLFRSLLLFCLLLPFDGVSDTYVTVIVIEGFCRDGCVVSG